jgi:hypothetical protein
VITKWKVDSVDAAARQQRESSNKARKIGTYNRIRKITQPKARSDFATLTMANNDQI